MESYLNSLYGVYDGKKKTNWLLSLKQPHWV
jgi:hypothetical protein